MMQTLYSLKGSEFRIEVLAKPKVQEFINAHAEILDSGFKKVSMSDTMRRRLTRSDYIFSGMKTFHELHEAFPSLLDENGNRKPFEQFLNDVRKIDSTYNSAYLQAEYNFVHASAEMASKWEQFLENGDRYNLQYRTAHDGKVRPEHAALHGVTLPLSDPFWEEYYPPNGWNCRCTVVQVRKSKYPQTPHDEAMALGEEALQKDSKGIFHFNAGREQKTVPDYNPYTIRRCQNCDIAKGNTKLARQIVPDNELCAACQLLRQYKDKNKTTYEALLKDKDYTDVKYHEQSGGVKATHKQHNFDKNKGFYEKDIQDAGYKHGHSVVLEAEPQNVYQQKSCEGLWDGKKFEVAGVENGTANNVRNSLKHCASKPECEIAVLYFPNTFCTEYVMKGVAKFNGLPANQYRKFKAIYCIHQKKIVHVIIPQKRSRE